MALLADMLRHAYQVKINSITNNKQCNNSQLKTCSSTWSFVVEISITH